MKFRTELILPSAKTHISHNSNILLLGSCFSENLGNFLSSHKFNVTINPFGTLYDPYSIFNNLNNCVFPQNATYDFLKRENQFFTFQCHSSVNAHSEKELSETLNNINHNINNQLINLNYLFITLGTAFVYKISKTDTRVANCHKQNSKEFVKILENPTDVIENFKKLHNYLKTINPKLQIVFTLSPVRHIKDGIVENQLSKSILRYCISEFEKFDDVSYFPAYEIMMDDLRDYRFYTDDLLHPNNSAIAYIWSKFQDVYFEESTKKYVNQLFKLNQSINHRPFNEFSEVYLQHLQRCLAQCLELESIVNMKTEINELEFKIKNIRLQFGIE
ncbi:MAG: GSCFA domain-containing protein [Cytophagales bacterium]